MQLVLVQLREWRHRPGRLCGGVCGQNVADLLRSSTWSCWIEDARQRFVLVKLPSASRGSYFSSLHGMIFRIFTEFMIADFLRFRKIVLIG